MVSNSPHLFFKSLVPREIISLFTRIEKSPFLRLRNPFKFSVNSQTKFFRQRFCQNEKKCEKKNHELQFGSEISEGGEYEVNFSRIFGWMKKQSFFLQITGWRRKRPGKYHFDSSIEKVWEEFHSCQRIHNEKKNGAIFHKIIINFRIKRFEKIINLGSFCPLTLTKELYLFETEQKANSSNSSGILMTKNKGWEKLQISDRKIISIEHARSLFLLIS